MLDKVKVMLANFSRQYYLYAIPLFFGFFSLFLGQDRNWDLAAYHLYNGFAYLNDKFDIDLSVAHGHTFFNPLLDAGYFFLNTHFPPSFVGFVLGFLHGLVFLMLYIISKEALKDSQIKFSNFYLIFLSLVGCFTPNFLSGLGNSMGDNTTAVLGLLSLTLIIKFWKIFSRISNLSLFILLLAGIFMGLSVGLKLTNAPFAVATCLSLLTYPFNNYKMKIIFASIFAISVAIGIFITSGFWFYFLWQKFHNPLFPQFSNFFPNEFSTVTIMDQRWGPRSVFEYIFWPFITSYDYHRLGEGLVHQILWPLFFLVTLTAFFFRVKKFDSNFLRIKKIGSVGIFIFFFVLISYCLWMHLFSIQRYLVLAEILVPLSIYILISTLFSTNFSKKLATFLLSFSTLIILLGGFGTWGHSRWSSYFLKSEKPKIENTELSTVLFTSQGMPISWIATQFPPNLSFVRVGFFPELYQEAFIARRKGNVYAMFAGTYNWRVDNVRKWNEFLSFIGIMQNKKGCDLVKQFVDKVRFRATIKSFDTNKLSKDFCYLDIKKEDYVDVNEVNSEIIKKNNKELNLYNYTIDESSCTPYMAMLGSQKWSYIFCKVKK